MSERKRAVEYAALDAVTTDGEVRSAGGQEAWLSLASFLGISMSKLAELRAVPGALGDAIEVRRAGF